MGGVLWAVGVTLAGYFLGNSVPNVDRYFLLIVVLIVLISAAPTMLHLWKEYRVQIMAWVRRCLSGKDAVIESEGAAEGHH